MSKWFIVLSVAVSLLCGGCGNRNVLYVYNWSDYIDPALVAQFEREHDCSVVIDAFDDNETMLAKLLAGASGYDVLFPSSYMIDTLVAHDLIAPLDTSLLPHVTANLDMKYSAVFHDKVMRYSVPYAFSVTGIAYRSDRFDLNDDDQKSWDLLKNPAFQHRVCLLNDIREMLGIGLRRNGYSINTRSSDELEQSVRYIKTLKRNARKMDNVQYRTGLVSGEYYIAVGYSSDILQVQNENPNVPIAFFVPNEGSTCCWDEMAVTKGANRALAHAFIDFLYRSAVAADNINYVCAPMPNRGMMGIVGDDVRGNPWLNLTPELLERLELVQDMGKDLPLYTQAWDSFLGNKEKKRK